MVDYAKVTELFQNEEFQKEAESFKTMEDFEKSFAQHGINIEKDEVVELVSQIAEKKHQIDEGEISEEDLENVSGGGIVIGTTLFCVSVGVICIGAACVAAYAAYQALNWTYKRSKKS